MKILYIYNISWFFCSHRLLSAKKLIKEGNDVYLICKIANKNDEIIIKEAGIKLYEINFKRGFSNILIDFFHLIKIGKIVNKIDPFITEIATIKPIIIAGLFYRFNKRKVVYWLSGLGYIFTSKKIIIKILKKIIIKIYKIIFNNSSSKIILENIEDQNFLINKKVISKLKSYVLPGSCVELEKYSYVKEPKKIKVLMPSRLLWNKGVGDYIEAIKILKEKNLECDFLLAGMTDDNPTSVPIITIQKWEKKGYIKYLGYVKDIIPLFQKSNLICLPSYREGLPKSLVEAGACSRASITTNVIGCRNIISNDFNGLLVEVNNSLELSNAIYQLVKNEKKRKLLAKNARKYVEKNFTHQIFYKRLKNIYFN